MFIAVEWKLSLFGLRDILPDAFCESFFRETDEQRHSGIDLKVDMKELYAPEGFLNFATFSSPVSYFFFLFRSIHVTVGRKRSGEWNERQTLGWKPFRSVEAESIDWSRHPTVPSIPVRRLCIVYECRLKLRNQNRRRNRRCKSMEEPIVRDRGLRTCVFPIVSSREKPTENSEQRRRHGGQACMSWRGFQLTNVYTYHVRLWSAYCEMRANSWMPH